MFYPLHPLRAFMYKNDAPISRYILNKINSNLYQYLSQELRIINEDKLTAINNCLLSYPQGINLNIIRVLLHCLSQHRSNEFSDQAKYSLKLICGITLNSFQNIISSQINLQQFDTDYHHKNYLHNIVTILKSFIKLPIDLFANEPLIIKCLTILEEQMHNLERMQIALILNSLPKLFLRPDRFNQQKPFMQKLLNAAEMLYLKCEANTNESSAVTNNPIYLERDEIVTLLCALPKIAINIQNRPRLIAFLLAEAEQKINCFNLKEISSLLIVIPKLGVDIAFYATLISSLLVRAHEKIQSNLVRDPYLVSNMLFILSTTSEINIDNQVYQSLLSVLLESAKQLVYQFNCVEITMLFSSIYRLGIHSYIHHNFIENLLAQTLTLIKQANNTNKSVSTRHFSEFEVIQILTHLSYLKVNITTHLELVDELLKLATNYIYTFGNIEFALLFIVLRNLNKYNILKCNHNTLLIETFKRAKIITNDLGSLEIAYILNALPELMNNDLDILLNRELIDTILAKSLEIVAIFNQKEAQLIQEGIKRFPQFFMNHKKFLELLEQRYALLQTQPELPIPLSIHEQASDQLFIDNSQQKIIDGLKLDRNENGIAQKYSQGFTTEFKPSHNALKRSYHVGMIKLESLRSAGKIQQGDEFEQWFSNQYIDQTNSHIGLHLIQQLYENGDFAEATEKLGLILDAVNKKLNLHNSQKSTSIIIQTLTPPSETVSECSVQNTSNSGDFSPNSSNGCEENMHEKMLDLAIITTRLIQCETHDTNKDNTATDVTTNDSPRPQHSNPPLQDVSTITRINPTVLSKRKLRQLRKANMAIDKTTHTSDSPTVYSKEQPQITMASMLFSFWKEIVKCCPFNNSDETIEKNYDRLKIL